MSLADRLRPELTSIGIVIAVAALLRAIYAGLFFAYVPDATLLYNDARAYWEISLAMQVYGWWLPDHGAYYQAPLYPMLLAILRTVGINETTPVIILQLGMGIANSLLTYALARRFLARQPSVFAACLFSACHLPLFYETKILATTFGVSLFLGSLLTLLCWIQTRPLLAATASAPLLALAVIARANLLFTVPCLIAALAWIACNNKRLPAMQRFLPVVAFTLAFIITLAPIPLRNGLIGGDWVPITANAGVTLYMGTNPLAQGGLGRIAGLSNDIEEQRTQSIEIASTEAGRTLSAAEASRHWINKTLAWITENPLDFVTLQMKKTLWGLHHTPPAVNQSVHFEQIHIPLIAPLKYVTAFTLTAGLLGTVFLLRRRSPEDLILLATFVGYLALTWVYYASDRFLVTLLPIMAIQAAMLFDQWHTVSARRRTTLLGAGFCIALVVINPWLSDNTRLEVGTGWYNLGVIYEDQQRPFDAREAYRSALDANPDHVSALLNLGVLYARQNDLATSTGLFERALQLDPANETARRNLEINRSRMSTP